MTGTGGSQAGEVCIGSTYVATVEERIAGLVTVSPDEMTADAITAVLKKKLPAYPIPILRIAWLAVDRRFQGRGIGKLLLRAMFKLALELRGRIGCAGVVVDAKPEAVSFCERLGFVPLRVERKPLAARPEPLPVFSPIGLIEKAVAGA